MIRGTGIDIIEVTRIRSMMRRHPLRFVERVFTPAEREYCRRFRNAAERFAARFAAKEAAMKALGTGLSSGIAWTDIEVAHDGDGRPIILLTGEAARVASRLGIGRLHVSLSHVKDMAVASVVAE